jgi:drug/metabolite transporter (DMT)-like permease
MVFPSRRPAEPKRWACAPRHAVDDAVRLCFAGLNATTRVITADLHSWQTVCLRYAFGALVMLPLVLRAGMGVLRTNNLTLQVARCAVHSLGTGMWFLALADGAARRDHRDQLHQPDLPRHRRHLFFGEKVRERAWIAIGVGFLGVLIVLYPKLEHGIAANWATAADRRSAGVGRLLPAGQAVMR